MARAEIIVDLDAVRDNAAVLRQRVDRPLMAVVKADAYGHGLLPCARASLAGGADMLGVAVLDEALLLREGGITAPILAWLGGPGEALTRAIETDVELSVSALWGLAEIQAAAREVGRPARIHLKADTGLSRGGATPTDWPDLVDATVKARASGEIDPVALWSHFVYADAPGHHTVDGQVAVFAEAVDIAESAGLRGLGKHLANSAATLTRPDTWLDMVRPGIACYGLDPLGGDPASHGLRPAMTVRAEVALVKRVPRGTGVSYGHAYVTDRETGLALVPIGYAEGVPRNATNVGPVWVGGSRRRVSGRVCMDQFVVDIGDDDVRAGDEVLLWGPGTQGEPTAQDWADALDTIHYELVTRIGGRMIRRYVGGDA
ncbi:MAG: alanine racemase [Geodermatophilaceae bacterium]|nr:alanine racemase [Geodermatophilaceae bacterium]